LRGGLESGSGTYVPISAWSLLSGTLLRRENGQTGTFVPVAEKKGASMDSADFSAALGGAVRSRRAALSLSQADVADLAGVSERFVRFVEQGKTTIQLEQLLAVLGTLGLELDVSTAGTVSAAGSVSTAGPISTAGPAQ